MIFCIQHEQHVDSALDRFFDTDYINLLSEHVIEDMLKPYVDELYAPDLHINESVGGLPGIICEPPPMSYSVKVVPALQLIDKSVQPVATSVTVVTDGADALHNAVAIKVAGLH